jgi:hypothetical protein
MKSRPLLQLVWACLVGVMSACSASSSVPERVDSGGEEEPFRILDLQPCPQGTTPDSLAIALSQNIDHMAIHVNVVAEGPVTRCYAHDVYRVGPNGVAWNVGETLTIALAYEERLPPGVYVQRIRIDANAASRDYPYEFATAQPFEVQADGLLPMSAADYSDAVTATTAGPNGEINVVGSVAPPGMERPSNPCPEFDPYTDVVQTDEATSVVDFDMWDGVKTVQPIRWKNLNTQGVSGSGFARLDFRFKDASGARLRLDVGAPPSGQPVPFDVQIGANARLWLYEEFDPNLGEIAWHAESGRVSVSFAGDEQIAIVLSDIVLVKLLANDEPRVRRTTAGTIFGTWIAE